MRVIDGEDICVIVPNQGKNQSSSKNTSNTSWARARAAVLKGLKQKQTISLLYLRHHRSQPLGQAHHRSQESRGSPELRHWLRTAGCCWRQLLAPDPRAWHVLFCLLLFVAGSRKKLGNSQDKAGVVHGILAALEAPTTQKTQSSIWLDSRR